MAIFSDQLEKEVRLEYMRPAQIIAAREERAAVYIPLGVLEWHGWQNAMGLDGIKAHEHLVGLAQKAGGVVHPPIYFGSGGEHGAYSLSYFYNKDNIVPLLVELLHGLEKNGYKAVVMLSGHYPNKWELTAPAKAAYLEAGGSMDIFELRESSFVNGDHAGREETSSLMYLHPECVDLSAIEDLEPKDFDATDEVHNWMGDEWKDHPNYGIVGADPRGQASAEHGKNSTEALIGFMEEWLDGKTEQQDEEWKGMKEVADPQRRG
ncbi:MAG: creatininase family protein [Planctomycetes bacterium]|nr:creatininase family protein [Planctomycetota bacterium]